MTYKTFISDVNPASLHELNGRYYHSSALKLLEGAPAQLTSRVKMYQDCLNNLLSQALRDKRCGYPDPYDTPVFVERCIQELVKCAKLAEPNNPKSSELVLVEIYAGGLIEPASIGYYIRNITVVDRVEYRLVQLPRWAHTTMLEAIAWKHPHRMTVFRKYKIKDACPTPTQTELVAANLLWEPRGEGPYKNFSTALQAVKLLA